MQQRARLEFGSTPRAMAEVVCPPPVTAEGMTRTEASVMKGIRPTSRRGRSRSLTLRQLELSGKHTSEVRLGRFLWQRNHER